MDSQYLVKDLTFDRSMEESKAILEIYAKPN